MATGQDGQPPEPGSRKLSVAEVLRLTTPRYIERYASQAAPQVQSTLAKLSLCRTAALGGRWYRCDTCDHECALYNSCGDRHCVQCAGAKRAHWMDSQRQLLLDGVNYFQVVFTLPGELSSLALGNRRAIYNLLFTSAWSALKETIQYEHGYDPAALMVLHTWNQQLAAHGHVHALVPGGGPALDGSGWVAAERRDLLGRALKARDASEAYLVDAVDLRRRYRDHLLAGLSRLRERGDLKLQGDFAHLQADDPWQAFLLKLRSTEWVSHIQRPPRQASGEPCGAEDVLKYLARYLTGGPISDSRIIAADEHEVTFWARQGKTPGGDDQRVPVTLPTLEFMRRWCLHILPKGYTKTRYFGGWHNRRREWYLERSAIMLEATEAPLPADAFEFGLSIDGQDADPNELEVTTECPHCGSCLRLVEFREKPSWAEILNTASRPTWYQPHRSHVLAAHRPKRIESAKETKVANATKFNARSIPLHPTPG